MYSQRAVLCSLALLFTLTESLSAQAPAQTVPFDRANLDTKYPACQDFYQFANGGWLQRAKIPGDYPTYGAFDQLFDSNQAILRNVLDTAVLRVKSGQYKPGTGEWKVGTFYATCMDTVSIERLGAAPLKPALDRIAAINSVDDLKRSLGELDRTYGLVPIGDPSVQDSKDAANTIAGLYQGVCRCRTASTTPRPTLLPPTSAPSSPPASGGCSSCSASHRPERTPMPTPCSPSRRSSQRDHARRFSCATSSTTIMA
jgi:hypothetical protein